MRRLSNNLFDDWQVLCWEKGSHLHNAIRKLVRHVPLVSIDRSTIVNKMQRITFERHLCRKYYDRNGTGRSLRVLSRALVHMHKDCAPVLILLCLVPGEETKRNAGKKVDYVIFI